MTAVPLLCSLRRDEVVTSDALGGEKTMQSTRLRGTDARAVSGAARLLDGAGVWSAWQRPAKMIPGGIASVGFTDERLRVIWRRCLTEIHKVEIWARAEKEFS